MTTEEKAKLYDKVSKEVKDFFEGKQKMYSDVNQTLEYLFPELVESEDEMIRKALREAGYEWDEKKKELRRIENEGRDKEINNFDVLPGLYKCVHSMFDGTPVGKLLFEVGNIYKCLSKHDRAEFEVSYGHSIYLEDPVVCKHFIPFEKQGEQKPKWGDDDEQYLLVCKNALRKYQVSDKWDADIISKWLDDKLKQGEQKPKWSEEDDKILIDCYNVIHRSDYSKEKRLEIVNWIKSLKERIIYYV